MKKMDQALKDLPLTLELPHIELKTQLLSTLLANPFLDDDIQGLSLRLGVTQGGMAEALDSLCQEGVLKTAGKRGYILDMAQNLAEPDFPVNSETEINAAFDLELPAILVNVLDAFPSGILILGVDGRQIVANEQMAVLLDIPRVDLDGDTFTRLTGVDLAAVALEHEISQVLDYPRGVEVIIRPCLLTEQVSGVFIIARQIEEVSELVQAQALFQEELFEGLRGQLVNPLLSIEGFLENPDVANLAQARGALERINWFLGDLFLAQKNGMNPIDEKDHKAD
jgi:PAS domain-containing protein